MARKGENIYKRKDGRWEGRYIKGYDEYGRPKQGYVYAKTYNEVKEKLIVLKANARNEKTIISSGMTVKQWFEAWLARKGQIKDSTRMIYKIRIDKHILPELGDLKLRALNKDILQRFIDKLTEQYKPATVKSIFATIKLALDDAEERNLISKFYTKMHLPKSGRTKIKVMTPKEQKALEAVIHKRNDDNDIGVLISLYTGMRIGEVCALRWENVDLVKKLIHVQETVLRLTASGETKTKLSVSSPKSIASQREIPLPGFLVKKLKDMNKDSKYVLNYNGRIIEPRSYTRRFKRLLKEAGIEDMGYHSTRHTFATRALEIGMDPKTLSELLGHASVGITLNLYAHSLDEHKKKEIERLGKLYSCQS